jgi:hypothetical protein
MTVLMGSPSDNLGRAVVVVREQIIWNFFSRFVHQETGADFPVRETVLLL